jgi:hypothetical protein
MPYISPEMGAQPTYLRTYKPQELVHFGGCIYCILKRDNLKVPTENGDDFFAELAATRRRCNGQKRLR